ncbi:MAG: nucleoside phosphorylase [Sphingobacteriales bacterium]|nr:nucleoside phosphorylase [Sphingobacteriales bacterium]
MQSGILSSELVLNADGSIYHLSLRPEEIADTVILVGDPDRVAMVSAHFDRIDVQRQHREFVTHTGELNGKRLTVISTGIGTDNIDIVINELDALVNIDLQTRLPKNTHTSLQFIRIGTSGALQPDIPADSFLASQAGIGLDGLMLFYQMSYNSETSTYLNELGKKLPLQPYMAWGDEVLLEQMARDDFYRGITLTCGGFYAPQGRQLRLPVRFAGLLDFFQEQSFKGARFTNFEMETAGIYALAQLLGHRALSLNAILANRPSGTFTKDGKALVQRLIKTTLERF